MITPKLRTLLFFLSWAIILLGLDQLIFSGLQEKDDVGIGRTLSSLVNQGWDAASDKVRSLFNAEKAVSPEVPAQVNEQEKELRRLQQASRDATRVQAVGIDWIVFGSFLCLLTILWNSSSIPRPWIEAVRTAFTGLGLLVVLLMINGFWQQYEIREQTRNEIEHLKIQEESDRKDKEKDAMEAEEDKERAKEKYQKNAEKTREIVNGLTDQSADKVPARMQWLGMARSLLGDSETATLAVVYLLYETSLSDNEPRVCEKARNILFPDLKPDASIPAILTQEHNPEMAIVQHLEAISITELPEGIVAHYLFLLKLLAEHSSSTFVKEKANALSPKIGARAVKIALDSGKEVAPTTTLIAVAAEQANNETSISLNSVNTSIKISPKLAEQVGALNEEELNSSIQALPEKMAKRLPARVYFHARTSETKAQAQPLTDALRKEDFLIPTIGVLGEKAKYPANTEVRYFDSDDDAKRQAEEIAGKLKAQGIDQVNIKYVQPTTRDLRNSSNIKTHFEVWLPADFQH